MSERDGKGVPPALHSLLGLAVDGIATWTAGAVRNHLGRLVVSIAPSADSPTPASTEPTASAAGDDTSSKGRLRTSDRALLAIAVSAFASLIVWKMTAPSRSTDDKACSPVATFGDTPTKRPKTH